MNEDRKTPEMRAQMTEIERLRHSASHVLATAILKIWPEAQFAAGPPVENGFYYDVDLPHRISPDDFGNIGAFRLTSVASAYYKGDEKNPQLQRVYGTAFKTKNELDEYFAMIEEAKKRDHRKLGRELEIFVLDDDVGPGLPMWLPRGAAMIDELEKLARETEFAAGYQRVRTPHIAKESLYRKSGHLPYYAESMFPPMQLKLDPEQEKELIILESQIPDWEVESEKMLEVDIEEGRRMARGVRTSARVLENTKQRRDALLAANRYYLKAMNCPHHHKLFAAVPGTYRDFPLPRAAYWTQYSYHTRV